MAYKSILDAEGIKAELRRRNISYNQIAISCGVSPSYVSKVIVGRNNRWADTTSRIKQAIADSIGVEIEELELDCTKSETS